MDNLWFPLKNKANALIKKFKYFKGVKNCNIDEDVFVILEELLKHL